MAERRMFARTIIDSDAFLDMPQSSQCLYFHLAMRADDDGFLNNPKKIQRMVNASDDDFKILIAKRFLIPFESGVVVIKHWRIHNFIRSDRYKQTIYKEELSKLSVKEDGGYTLSVGIPNDNQEVTVTDTQVRLGKVSIELGKDKYKNSMQTRPTIDEVIAYCKERVNCVDPHKWFDHYSSNGWKVGKNSMKDWKAAVRTWERSEFNKKQSKKFSTGVDQSKPSYSSESL